MINTDKNQKIKEIMSLPLSNVRLALHLASFLHRGQKYGKNSYFRGHILQVYAVAKRHTKDLDLIISAILHDSVEDANISLDTIQEIFGSRVSSAVNAVTDGPGEAREEKKVLSYLKLKKSPDGRFVKLCDRISNLTSTLVASVKDPETFKRKAPKYLSEHGKFSSLKMDGEWDDLWFIYSDLITKINSKLNL